MTEYMFGITTEKPSRAEARQRDRIAGKHGGVYVEVNVRENMAPGVNSGRYKAWYAIPNRGDPFDSVEAKAVLAEVEKSNY